MSKLRVLSGRKVVVIFERLGFLVAHTKGSHAKLVRRIGSEEQVLVVPAAQRIG